MRKQNSVVLLLLLAVTLIISPLNAQAAEAGEQDAPGVEFVCEPSADGSQLTVTAYLLNPNDQINAGMFVLAYDTSKLSASPEQLTAGEEIIISESTKYFNADKGYIGADWYPSASIEPSVEKTYLAVIIFNVNSSAQPKRSLSVCTDFDFLDGIGGYGNDEGVLLCTDSTHTFSAGEGTARVIFTLEAYASVSSEKDGASISSLSVVAVILIAIGLFAAAYYWKKKRHGNSLQKQ